MALVLQSYFKGSWVIKDMGSAVPAWSGGDFSAGNWWGDGSDTDFFHSMNGNDAYIQYGQNIPVYAGARFIHDNIVVNSNTIDNGVVTATLTSTLSPIGFQKKPSTVNGYRAIATITQNGIVQFQREINTIDSFVATPAQPVIKLDNIVLKPQQTNDAFLLTYHTHYPDGEFPDSEVQFGMRLFNDAPPTYKPWSIKQDGEYKTLNRDSGHFEIKVDGQWVDISTENIDTIGNANTGHSMIKVDGVFVQQNKDGSN